ncbi:alpha/beta fold hydrolase [Sinimarinibacterium sp. NLF-5-8]|uniref:alpha/beta fold hydrolase n=1 Tax=Sinimarinibacterium sp. NLF-5-8 TaxID=2698684 RepID=UPI00137BF520|nr:alpha/beta hydrolase [Sinimarinibacterium sp. NLF-5-8]QHS10216.1 alpha/beta hydrolase [Sinimarinibacterium sp. NLF-5-8]
MPTLNSNGLELAYETFGDPADPAVLLIMGLGGQLTLWPRLFCEALAAAGYYVVGFDNRDVGLSSKLDALGKPSLARIALANTLHLPMRAPYTLNDMARDSIGVLDALGIARAHIVGMSMGGMIAQLLAIEHRARVISQTLIMTSSGNPRLPGASMPVRLHMIRRPKRRDREGLIAHGIKTWRLIGSRPPMQESEDILRAQVAQQIDRSVYPRGFLRQMAAIMAAPSRSKALRKVTLPTLIIHGKADPLVPVAAAHELARCMPHARLEVIDHMGHDLASPLLPAIEAYLLQHWKGAVAELSDAKN